MNSSALTRDQRLEMQAARKQALEEMKARDPNYVYSMAGASISGGISTDVQEPFLITSTGL